MVLQDHIGQETGHKGHFTLGKIHHLGRFIDQHHGESHERIGASHGDSAGNGLDEFEHGETSRLQGAGCSCQGAEKFHPAPY